DRRAGRVLSRLPPPRPLLPRRRGRRQPEPPRRRGRGVRRAPRSRYDGRRGRLRTRPLRLFETRLDTIPPRPIRVRTQSARRLAVRFDEPIVLRDRLDLWTLTDSTSGADTPVLRTYPDTDPQQLVLV